MTEPALALRWDGRRVLFEIESAGERVACTISRAALQQISGPKNFSSTDMLESFARVRSRIELVAARKFKQRPESVSGIVSIWADDFDDLPGTDQEQLER